MLTLRPMPKRSWKAAMHDSLAAVRMTDCGTGAPLSGQDSATAGRFVRHGGQGNSYPSDYSHSNINPRS